MTDVADFKDMMPQQCHFPMVEIENENGWGPSKPLQNLQNLPLAGYAAKNDSLFQVADWYNTRKLQRRDAMPVNKEFESLKADKDFNFIASEVKKKKTTRKTYTSIQKARAARQHQRDNQKLRRDANKVQTGARSFGGFAQARRNKWQKRRNAQYKARQQAKHENQFKFEQSIQVKSTWGHKDDKWLPDMKDHLYELNEETYKVSRLAEVGRCKLIRKNLNRIRVDNPKVLKHRSRVVRRKWVSILQDEMLQLHEKSGDVFICSETLAALMTAPRSKMSWDVFVTKKEDGKLWFDMRPESPLQSPQPDEGVAKIIIKDAAMEKFMNGCAEEAKLMDNSFFYFTLDPKKETHSGADSAGRPLEQECSSISRYMKYELSDYTVICRCGFDAINDKGEPVIVGTATQHNPSKSYNTLSWNKDLDVKFAAAKTAVSNNHKFQFARWGIKMILSGAQELVLGFVSRKFASNAKDHQILKVLSLERRSYLRQWCHIKDMENAWGIFDQLVGYFKDPEIAEGKYCILRDANKERLSFYKVNDHSQDEQFV